MSDNNLPPVEPPVEPTPNLPKGLGYVVDPKDERDMLWRSAVLRERINVPTNYKLENLGPVLDQGQEPKCVAFSAASQKFYAEYLQHKQYFAFDPHWLYAECKKRDGIPNEGGTFIRVALEIMHNQGYKAKAGAGGLKEDTYFKIDNHVRLTSLQQIKEATYTIGPVLFGIGVDQGIFYPDKNGIVAEPNGQVEGGHAMLICGWDDTKECKGSVGAFWVKNSWGKSYGLDGYMWLPYSHFSKYDDWDAWKTVDASEVLYNPLPTDDPIVVDPTILDPNAPKPEPEDDADPLAPEDRDPSVSYCRCLCDGCRSSCKGWTPPNA